MLQDIQLHLRQMIRKAFPAFKAWMLYVDIMDNGNRLVVDFRINDMIQWKLYLFPDYAKNEIGRYMRYMPAALFQQIRLRGHHEMAFRNQWLGGGYSCMIVYTKMENLYYDIMKLVELTIDDSPQSNLQIELKTNTSISKYSIDIDELMKQEPPNF